MTKQFTYKGVNAAGNVLKGKVSADNEGAAIARVRAMGLTPTAVKPAGTGLSTEIKLPGSNKVGLKDLAIMARQFATMIGSGLSLLRALTILTEQTESEGLAKSLDRVRVQVQSGASLSDSLAKEPKVFPPLFINMVRAGEVGGFLDVVLLQIAANYEKEVNLRAKVKSAMTYPVVVFVIAVVAVIGMLLFIVPIFQGLFDGMGAELPFLTRMLVGISESMTYAVPILVVVGILLAVVWSRIRYKESTRKVVDPILLKTPIFGQLFQKVALSRFSRNFGTMLSSGVPILQCLSIVGETSGNYVITAAVRDVQESVRRGESFAAPLAAHKVFPAMMVQMLAVGEDTGSMDAMLHKLSDFYDQEVEATTEALASLIEPIMIAVLGAVIGGMVIGLYLPIFDIFNIVK